MDKISIIIPCYQNEENLPVTAEALKSNEGLFGDNTSFEYVLIDDGSTDKTWQSILEIKRRWPDSFSGIRLSKNTGSYNAICAGLKRATGNCIVVMAADLQDPPSHIFTMYDAWTKGAKLVLANRTERLDKWPSRQMATAYHFVIKTMALPNLPKGGFDFCLFDNQIKDEMIEKWISNTNSLFILLSLKHKYVLAPYKKRKRTIGQSQWTFSKKLKLFVNTVLAFSIIPPLAFYTGSLFLGTICLLVNRKVFQDQFPWSQLLILSAVLLFGLGLAIRIAYSRFQNAQKQPPFVVEESV